MPRCALFLSSRRHQSRQNHEREPRAHPHSARAGAVHGRHSTDSGCGANSHRRRFLAPLLAAVALAIVGLYLYVPGLYSVTTNDAYIDAHVVSVVPKVAAYVSALHVDDNQRVHGGQLMVELDPRDFAVAVASAAADMASAEANVANVQAQIDEQQAVIGQNEAAIAGDRSTLEFAQQQLDR